MTFGTKFIALITTTTPLATRQTKNRPIDLITGNKFMHGAHFALLNLLTSLSVDPSLTKHKLNFLIILR